MNKNLAVIILLSLFGCAQADQNAAVLFAKSPANNLVESAWRAVAKEDFAQAHRYADKCIELFTQKAKEINGRCDTENLKTYAGCEVVNDVGECAFVKAHAYYKTKNFDLLRSVCAEIEQYYFNSIVFDAKGWAWKPLEACRELKDRLDFGK